MNTHITQPSHKVRQSLFFFVAGLGIGFAIQQMVDVSNYQARLVRPVPVISISQELSLRQKRLAARILKRTLLRSANAQGLRSIVVADAAIHQAAPLASDSSANVASSAATGIFLILDASTSSSAFSSSVINSTAPVSLSAEPSSSISHISSNSLSVETNKSDNSSFPPFIRAVFPVSQVPNWGAMHTPEEWNRTYAEMKSSDFVPVPDYNLHTLTIPMASLVDDSSPQAVATITAKLFYSTRYFGAYDLDAGEFTAIHPAVDLKLARGTPVGAIGGGRVAQVVRNTSFGLHVMIEHRLPTGDRYMSIYAHLDDAAVHAGDTVTPGQVIGYVGMTGNTSAPHLHLQIEHLTDDAATHQYYWPATMPSKADAAQYVVNPITFIESYYKAN